MPEAKGILVIGEVSEAGLTATTKEVLGVGRRLADQLGEPLSVLLMGNLSQAGNDAIAFGADKVYVADNPVLASYQTDCCTAAAANLCAEILPSILLVGQTDIGRDLAPRLAARLHTGLCMDCVELAIDPQSRLMLMTRPVYGGNARAVRVCEKSHPQMATVRSKSQEPLPRNDARKGEVVACNAGVDESLVKVKVVERVKEKVTGVKLEDAAVVITGGRGLGGKQGFDIIRELAQVLGAAVGGSRAACEEGWLPTAQQVGLTGKIVGPNLYVAVGVSGAMQHLAGCSGSRNMVAINKDPDANIFKVCRFGVVGDYREAMPALVAKCRELLKG
ncbi:MAG: electron transfer flavoprotein subunit alpha/FixB family protein [Dehalococcoidia bacterium]|nr:electron transfer flavoprotein subunit alpha/FixB family protein [Dehalococcoidia bacterium]